MPAAPFIVPSDVGPTPRRSIKAHARPYVALQHAHRVTDMKAAAATI